MGFRLRAVTVGVLSSIIYSRESALAAPARLGDVRDTHLPLCSGSESLRYLLGIVACGPSSEILGYLLESSPVVRLSTERHTPFERVNLVLPRFHESGHIKSAILEGL